MSAPEKALIPVNPPVKLTVVEKLDLLRAGLGLLATGIAAAITGLVRKHDGTRTYRTHIRFAIIRRFLWRMSIRQLHFIYPTTAQNYERFSKRRRLKPETVQLEHGAQGHWLGKKDAKNVIVYYHGGGFALPAYLGYFQLYSDLLKQLNAAGKDVAMFFLSYTLTPEGIYPTQLRQAVEALRYIIKETGREPQNVFIGGDSAGGNLTMGVLSHLSHPHEAIKPLELSGELGGAFAMAPWVSMADDVPSYTTNAKRDYLSIKCGESWGKAFIGDGKLDNYNHASQAPAEWWKDIKTKCLLLYVGEHDVLLDSVGQFADKIKSAVPNLEYVVCKDEAHVGPIISRILGSKKETGMGSMLRLWLMEKIQ
ncbi:alpha/beta hydrolase fold protein [Nannizzia gypsea CBS 118893]|uniref:Alpha/beta hydrolase fold protein n=1 Tax=Arthroderma gypseum (strain ATCC MYA-4604 / CBS 118893) TaxID=535722 RepID=E4USH2_ARTGP|nr:alpha/beta hydrolase fold protein [Nannizzia gypsea CBS 118893]EFR00539.1 alpha/beta hydrolase fold protein [Nannizzia gypsea CBS 118893]